MSKNTALVVQDQVFALAPMPSAAEFAEILENNLLEGEGLRVREIPFPREGTFWQVTNEEGKKQALEELKAVILDYHALNVYYNTRYDGKKNPPTCISKDGKTGKGNPGGPCRSCSLGGDDAWGTGTDEKGNPTRGKACANKIRLFPLLEGEIMPHQITLPPTNNTKEPGGLKDFMNLMANKVKAYQSCIVSLTLEETKTSGGQPFIRLMVSKIADLSKEEAGKIVQFAKTLRPYLRQTDSDEILHGQVAGEGPDGVYDNATGAPIDGDGWN